MKLPIYNVSREVLSLNIGTIIYNRRKELGLTMEQVGNYVGVSKGTVKKWENGAIANVKRDKIAKLSQILKLNPITFITGEIKLNNNDELNLPPSDTKSYIIEAMSPTDQKEKTAEKSDLSPEQQELLNLFDSAPADLQVAALAVLRAGEAVRTAQGGEATEK